MNALWRGLWLCYEGIWWLLRALLRLLAFFKPTLGPQLSQRSFSSAQLQLWRKQRLSCEKCAIFFSSSAGEYEQAKPLAKRLVEDHGYFVLIVMGSASGTRFAEAQEETLPYHKAPWDRPLEWQKLLHTLEPDFLVVVRYELWPAFLFFASKVAPIYLIDAVQSPSLARSKTSRFVWRQLLQWVTHVFVVGTNDAVFYERMLGQAREKVSIAGDSKYDRVLERMSERRDRAASIRSQLVSFLGESRVLIVGSAWPQDLSSLLEVYPAIRRSQGSMKLIVAPHDISNAMAEAMLSRLTESGLRVCRVSVEGLASASEEHDVLLVDTVGYLAELYACAHLAWVGGGMHYRVHNVLEPACRGIYLCFGPRYASSQEASWLVSQGLAQVVQNGQDFLLWFNQLTWNHQPPHQALWFAVKEQEGASGRMLQHMLATQTDICNLRTKVSKDFL